MNIQSSKIQRSPNFLKAAYDQTLYLSAFAALKTTLTAPFHFIQVRYQTMGQMKRNGLINQNYKGYIDCARSAVKQQGGVSALFKGNLAKILLNLTGNMFSLTIGQYTKIVITQASKNNDAEKFIHSKMLGNVAGMLASYGTIFVTYPFEYAYTRLVTDKQSVSKNGQKQFRGIYHLFTETFKNDGIRGLYRGVLTNFGGLAAYRTSYFIMYDIFNRLSASLQISSLYAKFFLGYIVTVTAGAIVFPIGTIRRRMMMRSLTKQKYSWSGDCFNYVVKNQGFLSLYRGYPISLITGISTAIMMTLVDSITQQFHFKHH